MNKPELKDGFTQLAYELDAALETADFTKAERLVLRYAKPQLYGAAKLKTARLIASEIAQKGGWDRAYVSRGLRDLLRSNVLVKAGSDSYRLNKYYKTWTAPKGVRFTDGELKSIAHAPIDAWEFKEKAGAGRASKSSVSNQTQTRVYPVTNHVSNQTQECVQPDTNACLSSHTPVSIQTQRTIGTPASEDFKKTEEESKQERASEPIASLPKTPEAKLPATQIADLIITRSGESLVDNINRDFYEAQARSFLAAPHNLPTIEAAIEKGFAAGRTNGKTLIGYARKVLNDPENVVVKTAAPKLHQPKLEPVKTPEEIADEIRWMTRWYDNQMRQAEKNEIRMNLPAGTCSSRVQKPSILSSLKSIAS